MTERIIEVIKDRSIITGMDRHISEITGETLSRKPVYYRNNKTGRDYCHIAGGIGWPGKEPGFIVVVGVEKSTDEPSFYVLEEAESGDVNGLLTSCLRLREKYGYRKDSDLFTLWYGQNERFDSFLNDFNHDHELKDHNYQGIYLSPPHDYQKPNAFEIWLNTIRSRIKKSTSGKPKLLLANCPILMNHIQSAPLDVAVKGSVEEYPALSCLGGTLHSLMISRPWLKFVNPERTVPTIPDPLTELEVDHERALWEAQTDFLGDGYMDRYDDNSELCPTV